MKLRTEIEACPAGGVAWQVLCEHGEIASGRAFDATAALETADLVIADWRGRCEVVRGSLMEFAGAPLTEELAIRVRGRLTALAAIMGELT